MLTKALTLQDLTADGDVVAKVATLQVVDKDGDVTLPGFFGSQPTRMVWGHQRSTWVGKGRIAEEGDAAIFTGGFFMDTQAGSEAYKSVRAMGELAEWSYGFRLKEGGWKMGTWQGEQVRILQPAAGSPGAEVYEVSPVLQGAGEGTRTLALKHWQPGDPLPDGEQLYEFIKATGTQVQAVAEAVASLDAHLRAGGHRLSDAKATVLAELVKGLSDAVAAVQPMLDDDTEGEPAVEPVADSAEADPEVPPTEEADPTQALAAAHAHLEHLLVGIPTGVEA